MVTSGSLRQGLAVLRHDWLAAYMQYPWSSDRYPVMLRRYSLAKHAQSTKIQAAQAPASLTSKVGGRPGCPAPHF